MPTKKTKLTRIMISVKPETADVLKRMAELQNSTLSGTAGPILDGVAPHLTRMVAFMEAARDAPQRTQKAIIETLDRMEAEIMGIEHAEVARFDEMISKKSGAESDKSEGEPPCL